MTGMDTTPGPVVPDYFLDGRGVWEVRPFTVRSDGTWQGGPTVALDCPAADLGRAMTPRRAREVADALNAAADEAERGRGGETP